MNDLKKINAIFKQAYRFIIPPPEYTPSEWVEENLVWPDGPYAGQKMTLFEFQKEMIDALKGKKKKIVFETSAQIGKTSILNGILFYKSATDPGNAGVLQSTGKETAQWLAGKIRPLIDSSPEMQAIVTDKNDRNAVNNNSQIQLKSGGFWYFMSLNSPSHLRGKTLPLLLLDEVDAVESDTEEGNPILIAEQRATTFGEDARIFISSTPTGKYGAIHTQYEASDKRKYHVPCPACGHYHELVWDNVKFDKIQQEGKWLPNPDSAYIECPECKHRFSDGDRARAVKKGKWVQLNPQSDVAGFHISRLYSPLSSIRSVVEDYKTAFQSFSLSTFYNTVLGLPFDDLNEEIEQSKFVKLQTDISIKNIPEDTLFLTAGVDQQKDRLEVTLLGHTEKSVYILDHRSLMTMNAEVIESPVYREMLAFLKTRFSTPTDRVVPMAWANIDSGNGMATKTIYRFCSQWANLHAIKGSSQFDAPYVPTKLSRVSGYELYNIGVNSGKTLVRTMLNQNIKDGIHVPVRVEITENGIPDDYFEQLMSEELKRSGNGTRWVIKQGGVRNEALDCLNYGYCARLQVIEKIKWHEWRKLMAKQLIKDEPESIQEDAEEQLIVISSEVQEAHRVNPVRPKARRPQRPPQKRGWL
ncbi:terminase gpA endonuclease subunit [Pantoea sp. MBLJ3]|uniref:terminase gpA endonuclease subunit n=1 Tax=Pantoea sp. MBLJ3 TaxID=1562889 RepID=UPI00057D2C64|nr:terminase gpA endonuclease subunit [Pantoea sp. MBLJ3]